MARRVLHTTVPGATTNGGEEEKEQKCDCENGGGQWGDGRQKGERDGAKQGQRGRMEALSLHGS